MSWVQRLITGAAIAVIFAGGFLTGRHWHPETETSDGISSYNHLRTPEDRLAFLDEQLDLDPAQEQILLESFRSWEKDNRALNIENSRARLAFLETHYPEMREALTPEQGEDFDRMMRQSRKRQQQIIRRKERLFRQTYGE